MTGAEMIGKTARVTRNIVIRKDLGLGILREGAIVEVIGYEDAATNRFRKRPIAQFREVGVPDAKAYWVDVDALEPLPNVTPPAPHHLAMMDLLDKANDDVRFITGLPTSNESPFKDRFLGNGSEMKFIGWDLSKEQAVTAKIEVSGDGHRWVEFHPGDVEKAKAARPDLPRKPHRQPFPTPEATAWRPKL